MAKQSAAYACLVLMVAVLLTGCPEAESPAPTDQSIIGTWVTELGGTTYVVTFKSNGVYDVDFGDDGSLEVWGTYTVSGDQISFVDDPSSPAGCQAIENPGVYTYHIIGNQLTITLVNDPCGGRSAFDGAVLTKRL